MQGSKTKNYVIRSSSNDPWYNLALEEYLFNNILENQVILYLWQNNNCVVIGKNQNAWDECNWKLLEKEGGKLARRLSGGGAVFHDLGNLNFSFILDKNLYNVKNQLQLIINALNEFGIEAKFSGRNDITAAGRKFSGNAFYINGPSALHHGTILINTDMAKMARYLRVPKEKLASKGIESVQSRVINLINLEPSIAMEALAKALKNNFRNMYGSYQLLDSIEYNEDLKHQYEKYSSWEWRFGETPDFDFSIKKSFPWGTIYMGFQLKNGYINSAKVYSDAMDSTLIENLSLALKGIPFKIEYINESISNIQATTSGQLIIEDIKNWLSINL